MHDVRVFTVNVKYRSLSIYKYIRVSTYTKHDTNQQGFLFILTKCRRLFTLELNVNFYFHFTDNSKTKFLKFEKG